MILKSYISIHDVSPQNLDDIKNIIDTLKCQFNINKICILVIPGLDWKFHQIKQLKIWQNSGIEIAAHGWKHEALTKKSCYHKIHSLIMSANCAEHLSKNSQDIMKILQELNQNEKITIVVITHEDYVAKSTSRIVKIFDGLIVDDQTN